MMKSQYGVIVLISIAHAQAIQLSQKYKSKGVSHEIPAVCKQPPGTAICGPDTEAWYYDPAKRCCRLLRQGYCVDGGNIFPTLHKCKEKCQPLKGPKSRICDLALLRPCGKNYLAWAYDITDHHCKVVNHTACNGKKTVFISETICQAICLPHKARKPVCSQMIKSGNCSKSMKKWVFVFEENTCFPFSKKLCGKGANSFRTYPECLARCSYYENNTSLSRFPELLTNKLPQGGNTGRHGS